MDLETMLRNNLSANNAAGRALADYDLRVEMLADGNVLAIHMHPKGFNADVAVFAVDGDRFLVDSEIAVQVQALLQKRAQEALERDAAHAAQAAEQKAWREQVAAEEAEKAAAEAKAREHVVGEQ